MALGPKEMGERILRNLKAKTGKELNEWLDIIRASGLSEKKPVMDYLKTQHDVGHFQAQKIYEQFTGTDIYQNPEKFIVDLFNSASSMSRFRELESIIKQTGEDVKMQPCKTYIPFYRSKQFAVVTVGKSGEVRLGLNLPDDFKNHNFSKAKAPASERINFYSSFDSASKLDNSIKEAILTSYNLN